MTKTKIKHNLFLVPLILVSLVSVIPFYFVISMATHSTTEIYNAKLALPGKYLMENLQTIVADGFLKYYWNTIYTSLISAVLCVLISTMAAYALTVYKFKQRSFFRSFVMVSMMIPGQISILGYTIEMRSLHLINTHVPLILVWAASAYAVFFVMQYLANSLSIELIESARIDGSGEVRTFFFIAFPLMKPAIVTMFMLYFLWAWNNFLMPSTVLTDSSQFTIPLGIQTLATAYTQDLGARGAALTIAVIPMLILFSFGSKYFIQGLAAGAVKG